MAYIVWNLDNLADWSLHCGSGGRNSGAYHITTVIKDLANGHTLLTQAQNEQMFQNVLVGTAPYRSPMIARRLSSNAPALTFGRTQAL